MYQFSYAEVAEESFSTARDREREALDHALQLMQEAEQKGAGSREAVEAIYRVRSLWAVLVEDLASPENVLPEELRASLISIGLWVMREAENIRLGRTKSFAAMIEITTMIRDGLGD